MEGWQEGQCGVLGGCRAGPGLAGGEPREEGGGYLGRGAPAQPGQLAEAPGHVRAEVLEAGDGVGQLGALLPPVDLYVGV